MFEGFPQESGTNFVELKGRLIKPVLSTTSGGYSRLSASVSVPKSFVDAHGESIISTDSIRITAWGKLAESLSEVPAGQWVKVQGSIVARSYQAACQKCGVPQRKYWYEVGIYNFVVLDF